MFYLKCYNLNSTFLASGWWATNPTPTAVHGLCTKHHSIRLRYPREAKVNVCRAITSVAARDAATTRDIKTFILWVPALTIDSGKLAIIVILDITTATFPESAALVATSLKSAIATFEQCSTVVIIASDSIAVVYTTSSGLGTIDPKPFVIAIATSGRNIWFSLATSESGLNATATARFESHSFAILAAAAESGQ